ncbi:CapA family protein [Microbulbifer pacificus]|uniref:CapA family protein n=1 Tax=Microbulbifer pacificus TaxID=407164 RepID=UPI000CF4A0A6|nr:CapA family protein [Microbulbifer pacificus]
MAASNALSELLSRARLTIEQELSELTPPYTLFFSVSDGIQRARVCHGRGMDLDTLWLQLATQARRLLSSAKMAGHWLRIDWVTKSETLDWRQLHQRFEKTKRGYFRYGLALDDTWNIAFLEQELNGNAMLYGGNKIEHVVVNKRNFRAYTDRRFGRKTILDFADTSPVTLLHTEGVFLDRKTAPQRLYGPGRNAGRRIIDTLDDATTNHLINTSSQYLASQVLENGRFEYGWHCCFDRPIGTYNTLRHASSTYALTEGWEVTGDEQSKHAIDRALAYLTEQLIKKVQLPSGRQAAFLVESNGEIKLGGNAVCLLALVKYSELTGTKEYCQLLEELALGIQFMQDNTSGKFVHVLQYPELTVKEKFRIIYYDGEAAFGLMRLYGYTKDERWLSLVEKAFEYFIANKHWQAHDHWLSYCVNELTLYRPETRYYQFGIQNVSGHLDFIIERITTFPTLLELIMAAERMVTRLRHDKEHAHLLRQLDLHKFYRALHTRAMYLLNGYYWPEYAMYFSNPAKISGSFFIRHHAFRVRIDDVEHYLSGFVAFRKYLLLGGCPPEFQKDTQHLDLAPANTSSLPILAWGGDVNLARRQHYRTALLGEEEVLGKIPALNNADLSVVNLECVVATTGEQGTDKGEHAPYYYRARPGMLKLLYQSGIDVVTTANNHSGDYGKQALLEQGYWLDTVGIGHTGSGFDFDTAMKPVIRPAGALNVAIFSLDATQKHFAAGPRTPGCAHLSIQKPDLWLQVLEPRIAAARKYAHVVVVAVHWGDNLEEQPSGAEIAVGHRIIEAGADAVLGTSAHILQGIEIYQGRPIIHDAGDLLFDSVQRSLKDGGIFQLALSYRGVEEVRFIPIGVGFGFSHQLSGQSADSVTRRFEKLCAVFGTKLQILGDGSGKIALNPPVRKYQRVPPAAKPSVNMDLLDRLQRPLNPSWAVAEVPSAAQIPPMDFGPLQLIGVQYHPKAIERRQLLYVETFWRIAPSYAGTIDMDLRLNIRAVPVNDSEIPYWGKGMDHDPCDWQVPTSCWQHGIIYRDYYCLRPPATKHLKNIPLQLQVGIISEKTQIKPIPVPDRVVPVILPLQISQPRTAISHSRPIYRSEFPASVYREIPGQTWNAQQLEDVTGGTWLVAPPPGWYVASVVSGKSFIHQSQAPTLFVAHSSRDRAFHENRSPKHYSDWDLHRQLKKIVDTFGSGTGRQIAGVMVSKPVKDLPGHLPVLLVQDPIRAVVELGFSARNRFRKDVVAITGTAGKSSTLKMLNGILREKGNILTSLGNYNSRVGVPTTLASLNNNYQAALLEIAQSALWMRDGPITQRVHPTVAVITEIGVSQTAQGIRTTMDTATWKSRIFTGLTGRSIAVIGEHLAHFDYIRQEASKHAKRIVVFGASAQADIRILHITGNNQGSHVTLQINGEHLTVSIPVPSTGMVYNAVAAISVAYAMGYSAKEAIQSIQSFQPDDGHLQQTRIPVNNGFATMIDDSWNAEVTSMLNAFSVLEKSSPPEVNRKIAILGRIVHLGEQASVLHRSLARPLMESGVSYVITHGEEMKHLRTELPAEILGPHYSSASELARSFALEIKASDLILVKGSRRDSDFGEIPKLLRDLLNKELVNG